MAYSIAWIAAKTDSPGAVWDRIGVTGTGKYDGRPALSGAMLPSGWYLMIYDHRAVGKPPNNDYCRQPDLEHLSVGLEVIHCDIEEHIIWHSAEGWEDGNKKWSVEHNSEKGMYHLTVTGDPPEILDAIKAKYFEQQDAEGGEDADVDLISEIPMDLAKAITGYKHDELSPELAGVEFEELAGSGTAKPFETDSTTAPEPEPPRPPEQEQPGPWASLCSLLGFGPRR